MPGCGDGVGEPGEGPGGGAPGNPLEPDTQPLDGVGIANPCPAYAAKAIECAGDYQDYQDYDVDYGMPSAIEYEEYCEYYISQAGSYAGSGCAAAFLELFVCLSVQDCEVLDDEGPGCRSQESAVELECFADDVSEPELE